MTADITGTTASRTDHRLVSREEWVKERKKLLAREKELTRHRDEIAAERRASLGAHR